MIYPIDTHPPNSDHIQLGMLVRVKARNYDMQCEIERLKKSEEARIRDMQREMDSVNKKLEEARAELKETQAVLGQAFASGSMGKQKASVCPSISRSQCRSESLTRLL